MCPYKRVLCPPLEISPVPAAASGDSNPLFPEAHPNHHAGIQSGVVGGEHGNVFSSAAEDGGSVCSKENDSIVCY